MTSNQQRRYLVAYDIANDKRRSRVAHILQSYGDRVQYSVFVVDIKPSKLVELRARVNCELEWHSDSVLVGDLGSVDDAAQRRFEYLGKVRSVTDRSSFVV